MKPCLVLWASSSLEMGWWVVTVFSAFHFSYFLEKWFPLLPFPCQNVGLMASGPTMSSSGWQGLGFFFSCFSWRDGVLGQHASPKWRDAMLPPPSISSSSTETNITILHDKPNTYGNFSPCQILCCSFQQVEQKTLLSNFRPRNSP